MPAAEYVDTEESIGADMDFSGTIAWQISPKFELNKEYAPKAVSHREGRGKWV